MEARDEKRLAALKRVQHFCAVNDTALSAIAEYPPERSALRETARPAAWYVQGTPSLPAPSQKRSCVPAGCPRSRR